MKKLYAQFYKYLPKFLKGLLTLSLYQLNIKPRVNTRGNGLQRGVVVFSADFEMAWAFQYSKTLKEKAVEQGRLERNNVPVILRLFDDYNIPVTWATVGHLFLDSCQETAEGSKHPDMPRPGHFVNRNWTFTFGDWYQYDPSSNYQDDPAWYAPDLIQMIRDSKTSHEFGCHSFSHIDFSDKHCTSELAKAEIKKCKEVSRTELSSMVFPGGTEGNLTVLKEEGFLCYRKPMNYDIDSPFIDQFGLVAIPSSYGMDKPAYNWSSKTCLRIVKKYVNAAIKSGKVCHLWFHPSMDAWYLNNVLPHVLDYVAHKRDLGMLDVMTMKELTMKRIEK